MTDDDLLAEAKKAMTGAYAPYSRFRVGAALVTRDGQLFTGANVENASYGLTLCAERVAVVKGVTAGAVGFDRIAVVSSSGEETFPCGACRQVLHEFGTKAVIVAADEGRPVTHLMTALLPHAFGPDSL
ncbi:MAG: cytidine deaminase [Nitrospinae bacterium]|nr:cytidine deaminase [Nitrospinota bacterium]